MKTVYPLQTKFAGGIKMGFLLIWFICPCIYGGIKLLLLKPFANNLDPDKTKQNDGPDLDPKQLIFKNLHTTKKHANLSNMQRIKSNVLADWSFTLLLCLHSYDARKPFFGVPDNVKPKMLQVSYRDKLEYCNFTCSKIRYDTFH